MNDAKTPSKSYSYLITPASVWGGVIQDSRQEETDSNWVLCWRHRSLHWRVWVHLRLWSWDRSWTYRDLHSFMPAVGQGASPGLRVVQAFLRAVLHRDDAVEGL